MLRSNNTVSDLDATSAPAPDDVRAELERILASPDFQSNNNRRAFLRYIVEEALAGRADRLKGYAIAVDVYGRDASFDSKADPIIRLEARRLRRDLHCYYGSTDSDGSLIISVPKGGYVPRFEPRKGTAQLPASSQGEAASSDTGVVVPASNARAADLGRWGGLARYFLMAAAVACAFIVVGIAWLWTTGKHASQLSGQLHGPAVVVLPFRAMNSSDLNRILAEGTRHEIVAGLMRFPGFRLFNPTGIPDGAAATDPDHPAHNPDMTYIVKGSVSTSAKDVRFAIELSNAVTGRVLLAKSYDRQLTPESLVRVQTDVASEIASAIGQPYGAVNSDLDARIATEEPDIKSYLCVLRGYDYRRGFAREKFEPALQCLTETIRRDPRYSDAWAMLGWLRLDAARIGYFGSDKRQEQYEEAVKAASRAVELAPNSIMALKALASINYYLGRYDVSEHLARRALALNPHDPEALAQLGWRLAARGNFAEGIPFLKRAIARIAKPPGWYYHLVAIDFYLKKNFAEMLTVAERSAVGGRGVSQALIAIAAGELGQPERARQALKNLSEFEGFARDPAAYLRRHGAVDEIVNPFMTGLKKARRVASRS
jgi:TolB-like protein